MNIGIVGAGPAGAFCAYLLAQAGFPVCVFEGQETPKRKVCGEYLGPGGVKILEEAGLLQQVVPHPKSLIGMRLVSPEGEEILGHFPQDKGPAHGLALNRQNFDENLRQLAQQSGAHINYGTKIEKIYFNSQRKWELTSQQKQSYSFDFLIGADGLRSQVAKELGLELKTHSKRVAIHFYMKGTPKYQHTGEMHVLPHGMYVGIDPVEEGLLNMTLVCDGEWIKKFHGPWPLVQHIFQGPYPLGVDHPLPTTAPEIRTLSPLTHQTRKVVGKNFALIGDAAGFVDPLTGEGITRALWGAQKVAQELLLFKESTSPDLDIYLKNFAQLMATQVRGKNRLSHLFQWIIRSPTLCQLTVRFLRTSPHRAQVLMGLIGNIYLPWEGLGKIIA